MKESLVSEVARVFGKAGYQAVSCEGMQSSFDVLAKGGNRLFLVKVLSNVESFTTAKSSELKSVAGILQGIPLIVGERIKSTLLEGGVVYERYGVHVVSVETLKRMLDDEAPTAYTVRGNYCVRVNPGRLSEARRRLGFTQDELAGFLGVSKQSVYRYECHGRMSTVIAERVSELFGEVEGLFLPNDVFCAEPSLDDVGFEGHVSGLKRRTFEFFRSIGFDASLTKAPFDIVLRDEDMVFIAVSNDWRRLERRIQVVEEISDAVGGFSVCITERARSASGVVLKPEDLKEIRTSREFIRLLS
jgi:putative transcriptional regulator